MAKRRLAPDILDVADDYGPDVAIDTAIKFEVPPERWADDLADDYDLEPVDLYNAYYAVHGHDESEREVMLQDGDPQAILDIAADYGPGVAVQTARYFDISPQEWADDIGYDYDLDVHDLYEEFFYPSDGASSF